jgi:hypothetical protein
MKDRKHAAPANKFCRVKMESHCIGCSETAQKWVVAVQIVASIFVRYNGSSSMRSANSYFRLKQPPDDLLQN